MVVEWDGRRNDARRNAVSLGTRVSDFFVGSELAFGSKELHKSINRSRR